MNARTLLPALLLLLAPALHAQTPPEVHVIATGGTISNTGGERLTGEALVRSLPGIERVARVTVEQFSNVPSGSITLEQLRALSTRIAELHRSRPQLMGVVVTHGTDTMEETAYFLDLTVPTCRPLVVTGAMRRATDPGADGPANLFNAIRLIAAPAAQRAGTLVLMNDYLFPAREVTKTHTSRVDAFAAPGVGPLGVADPDTLVFFRQPASPHCDAPVFDLARLGELPRVDVVHSYLGADGALIRAAVDAGARGVVVAGVGRGGMTPGQSEAVRQATERGVVVVMSSRTGAGRVPTERDSSQVIGANDLNPHKARVLLLLALASGADRDQIRAWFEEGK